MSGSFENLVATQLRAREEAMIQKNETAPVTLRLSLQHIALLDAIAELLETTRSAQGGEILSVALTEYLELLPKDLRRSVAEKADKKFADDLIKRGGQILDEGRWSMWQALIRLNE